MSKVEQYARLAGIALYVTGIAVCYAVLSLGEALIAGCEYLKKTKEDFGTEG